MMSERTNHMGKRVELRRKRTTLAAQAETFRDELRMLLDPIEDVAVIAEDRVAVLAMSLSDVLVQIKETDAKLCKLAELLGE